MNRRALSLSLLFSAMLLVLSACGSGGGSAKGQMSSADKAKTTQSTMQNHKKNKSSDQDSGKAQSKTNDKMNQSKAKKSNRDQEQGSMDSSKHAATRKNQSNANDRVLHVTAHNFSFNKKKFVVHHGKITIHFKSIQGTHGFAVYKSPGSTKKLVNIVGKGTKTVTLQPGKYYIHCSVVCGGGHGQMDATLIVK
ncbi:MAG TPA: hypothetical protein VFK33_16020 [Bacillales bacterium]|nr:hypothetical protein [Bacillales bacterium]